MSMLEDVKPCLRVDHDLTDAEIQMWIDAAVADMRRCGVREWVIQESANAKAAIVQYVKSNYGYDNAEADRFMASYREMVTGLLNSSSSGYIDESVDAVHY